MVIRVPYLWSSLIDSLLYLNLTPHWQLRAVRTSSGVQALQVRGTQIHGYISLMTGVRMKLYC